MLKQCYGENIATSIVAHGGMGVHRPEDIFWASSLEHLYLSTEDEGCHGGCHEGFHKGCHHAYGRRGASFCSSPGLSRSLAQVTPET